ncbi:MAG: Nitrogenase (molybdenum-iron)-specific transcriptional regulator NifA [Labilithrix sp.]|nr:Nitrogenase (molybdenum-iron)-specific transcriptional regulator NifA [Labilithrix sp.]
MDPLALTSPSLALVNGSPHTSQPAADGRTGRTFVELDERLIQSPPAPGVVIVRAPSAVHAALIAHAARRLRASGITPVDVPLTAGAGVTGSAPLFREVGARLGLTSVPSDAQSCAEAVAHAAGGAGKRAAIIASLPKLGSWDRAVATELVRDGSALVVFVTTLEDSAPNAPPALSANARELRERETRDVREFPESAVPEAVFELGLELSSADRLRWLGAVAEEAHVELPGSSICALEAWWTRARRVAPATVAALDELAALGEAAAAVFTCLVLAGRSVPQSHLESLGDDASSAVDALLHAGFVARTDDARALVSVANGIDVASIESRATDAERLATARLLIPSASSGPGARAEQHGPGFDPDPWAHARAAELLVAAGALDAADRAIGKALRGIDDPQAAFETTSRWFACVARITGEGGLFLRVQAAQRALTRGEAIEAQRWCESAAVLAPADPSISLLMGKSLLQLGDLVSARVCLEKAEAAASTDELRAQVASELAELSYLAGKLDLAREHATRAVALASAVSTRLNGRNTLGKINLVESAWDEADAHFAADVMTASAAGDGIAELRARLNRGIALMSKGGLDDARAILVRVLEDGKRMGEDRACAYAFANLGVIASRQHDYASALLYWEQAVRFRHTLRGRIASARTIANLAELRLRLGLVDHAEHAISFGRRLLGSGVTAARASHFAVVGARIALARGNGELARREIDSALVDGEAAGDRDYLGEAYRVAARVALDEGDVNRAAEALAKATALASNDRARADVALVRALHLRATGAPAAAALEAASSALTLARAAGEEDLLAEIHTLMALLGRDAGDLQAAQAHCSRALAVRDQVAAALPVEIRSAFLAKPEIVALSRLQAAFATLDQDVEEEAPRTQRMGATPVMRTEAGDRPVREMIGDDAQIRNLQVAIRKVARANSTVLIRGESGTGKELVAEALHRAGDRANGPLVSVNCAALVETLLLSELFGHEKGAFTGAAARRRGRFEMAEGGTLFLDEIGDISSRTQVALLRVLQEKTFERVGGAQPIRANVRVICATHRDLKAMVERGEFREDLYYRLKGITLEVPTLRARLGDLPKIADHLLGRIAVERAEESKVLGPDAIDLLQRHRWPGNIRELENVLRAVSLFAEGRIITTSDLVDNVDDLRSLAQAGPMSQPPMSLRSSLMPPPSSIAGALHSAAAPSSSSAVSAVSGVQPLDSDDGDEIEVSDGSLPEGEANATAVAYAQVRQGAVSLADIKRQIERDCIARALVETKGNITRAAALLGMKRPRLSQLVKQYGLAASSEGSP